MKWYIYVVQLVEHSPDKGEVASSRLAIDTKLNFWTFLKKFLTKEKKFFIVKKLCCDSTMVVQLTCNQKVEGSSPSHSTKYGRMAEWFIAAVLKTAGSE